MCWEQINCLASFTREARDVVLEQGWSSFDLFGEVLEGANPSPRLHQLGTSPAEVDQCFEEVEGEERDEEEHEDYNEDLQEGVEQVPGGEGWLTTPLHCTLLTLEPDTSVREEEPLLGPQGWA